MGLPAFEPQALSERTLVLPIDALRAKRCCTHATLLVLGSRSPANALACYHATRSG